MLLSRSRLPLILLIIQLSLWTWRTDALFQLSGIVRVQSACAQSSLWSPAPVLVQNLCLRCFCVNAIFSMSICKIIPNVYVSAGFCIPIPVNATLITAPVTVAPITTTTTTTLRPAIPGGIGGILPAVPGVGGAGQILPAQPGVTGVGQILPAQPGVTGVGQVLPGAIPASPGIQSIFPGLGNYLPGAINTLGGVPATLSPGSGIAGFGFTAPNADFNSLAGAFPGLLQGKRK